MRWVLWEEPVGVDSEFGLRRKVSDVGGGPGHQRGHEHEQKMEVGLHVARPQLLDGELTGERGEELLAGGFSRELHRWQGAPGADRTRAQKLHSHVLQTIRVYIMKRKTAMYQIKLSELKNSTSPLQP